MLTEDKPVPGDQLYVYEPEPPLAVGLPPKRIEFPAQIVSLRFIEIFTDERTVTEIVSET